MVVVSVAVTTMVIGTAVPAVSRSMAVAALPPLTVIVASVMVAVGVTVTLVTLLATLTV